MNIRIRETGQMYKVHRSQMKEELYDDIVMGLLDGEEDRLANFNRQEVAEMLLRTQKIEKQTCSTCHRCMEGSQECGYAIHWVAGWKDAPLPDAVHSAWHDGLLFSFRGITEGDFTEGLIEWEEDDGFPFSYGETIEEAIDEFLDENLEEFKRVVLLNCAILTAYGDFKYRQISNETARLLVQEADDLESAIGHQSTAEMLTELLEVPVQMNRQFYKQQKGEIALVFRLKQRPPEGTILDREVLEKIGFEFATLKMM